MRRVSLLLVLVAGLGGCEGGVDETPLDLQAPDLAAAEDARTGDMVSFCGQFCDCMESACSTQSSYPWATPADCQQACAGLSDEQRTCYSGFCLLAEIATPAQQQHYCEHAWGALGLQEC